MTDAADMRKVLNDDKRLTLLVSLVHECRTAARDEHWTDLLRTAISIREGRVSSVTLLRRLGNHSRKNRLYRAFRELGRVIRTITLLRYLSEPELREQITAITNKAEAFHGYSEWLMVGGRLIGHNDPDHHELVVKFNELMANCAIYSTALDITDAGRQRLRVRGQRGRPR
ncbi:Tn3 family transposase [Amycolatopsis sp. CA-161197]|uniref:Tn3 family transposase n=1 Tax=Amycolatopsis sp. CA-161197 TaxID=3239922 RepID=UPI003D9179D7